MYKDIQDKLDKIERLLISIENQKKEYKLKKTLSFIRKLVLNMYYEMEALQNDVAYNRAFFDTKRTYNTDKENGETEPEPPVTVEIYDLGKNK